MYRIARTFAVILYSSTLLASPLTAQEEVLPAGLEIRYILWADGITVHATVASLTPDTAYVSSPERGLQPVAWEDLFRLQIRADSWSDWRNRAESFSRVGAVVGGVAGTALGTVVQAGSRNPSDFEVFVAVSTGAGALLGALLGSASAHHQKEWRSVDLTVLRAATSASEND